MATKPTSKPSAAPQPAPGQQAAAPQGATQPASGIDSSDPNIAKVQDAVRNSIPPQFRVACQKIVLAGMKVMFSDQTHPLMLAAIKSDTDPAHAAGMGVTQLITILFKQSKGQMPIPAIIPAAILLVCEALDFMEKSKLAQVTPDVVSGAVQIVVAYLLQKLGLSPQKVSQIAQQNGQGQPGVAPIQGQSAMQQAVQQTQQASPTQQPQPQPPQPQPAAPPADGAGGGLVAQQMGA